MGCFLRNNRKPKLYGVDDSTLASFVAMLVAGIVGVP
jgi:hypothetical protein